MASEGGKHWTDEEVQALLYIWADPIVQRRLQGTVRNKSIFQEVAQKLQSFGVHRDWKQCRSKYKNLKYDYKNSKTSGVGYLGKTMKFFREVEAILEGRAMRTTRVGEPAFRRGPEGDRAVLWQGPEGEHAVLWKAQEADRATVRRTQESEQASLGSLRRRPDQSNDVDEGEGWVTITAKQLIARDQQAKSNLFYWFPQPSTQSGNQLSIGREKNESRYSE